MHCFFWQFVFLSKAKILFFVLSFNRLMQKQKLDEKAVDWSGRGDSCGNSTREKSFLLLRRMAAKEIVGAVPAEKNEQMLKTSHRATTHL
ncbi:MAG: hypothetical protein ABS949_18170 [Solibacillus sp.]